MHDIEDIGAVNWRPCPSGSRSDNALQLLAAASAIINGGTL